MRILKLTETELTSLIEKMVNETKRENNTRYMFFSNLEQMKRQCEILLEMDESLIVSILENGHDWAQDHIAESKNNMDQVFDFLMNESKQEKMEPSIINNDKDIIMMESKTKKNKPTNPTLWKQSLDWAKQRYDVCPSAYCNGAAAKRYKSKGGKWKKG
jgi:hypothetical protein